VGTICYDLEEKVYGTQEIRISQKIKELLCEYPEFYCVILDGAKPESDMQWCLDRYSSRVINSGIAEQNMIGVSAGIASLGNKVICMSYGPFMVLRALEQIYMDVAYNKSPVCIIATNAGISAGEGPTHNNVIDFAVLRAIPDITLVAPCDPQEVLWTIDEYIKNPRPMYIRCGGANEPLIYKKKPEEFRLGKAQILQEGDDLVVFAAGTIVYKVLQAAQRLLYKGIKVTVVNMHTIKPLDKEIISEMGTKFSTFLVVEEHKKYGGLGSAIAEVVTENGLAVKQYQIAIEEPIEPDGTAEELYEFYSLTSEKIVEKIVRIVQERN